MNLEGSQLPFPTGLSREGLRRKPSRPVQIFKEETVFFESLFRLLHESINGEKFCKKSIIYFTSGVNHYYWDLLRGMVGVG